MTKCPPEFKFNHVTYRLIEESPILKEDKDVVVCIVSENGREDARRFVVKQYLDSEVGQSHFKRELAAYQTISKKSDGHGVYGIPKRVAENEGNRSFLFKYLDKSLDDVFAPLREDARQGNKEALNAEIKKLAYHMAAALKSLHSDERGSIVVHLDIHPTNIRKDKGRYWLFDFGWAHTNLVTCGQSKGCEEDYRSANNEKYRPPEQKEEKFLRPTSDIYSLGCVLYYAYRGKHFAQVVQESGGGADKLRTVLANLRAEDEIFVGLPVWLRRLLVEMLAYKPEKRLQNGNELRNRLPEVLRHEAEWLLSDREWTSLNMEYDRSMAFYSKSKRYRLGRGKLLGFDASIQGAALAVITSTGVWIRNVLKNQTIDHDEAASLPRLLAWTRDPSSQTHLLAVAYHDKKVKVWKYENTGNHDKSEMSLTELVTLPALPNLPISLAWSARYEEDDDAKSDKTFYWFLSVGATGDDVDVTYIWQIYDENGVYQQFAQIFSQHGCITALAWAPDSPLLLTGSEGGILQAWQRDDYRFHRILSNQGALLDADDQDDHSYRPNAKITGIAWTKNDERIIVTDDNGRINLIEIRHSSENKGNSFHLLDSKLGHTKGVTTLRYLRDLDIGATADATGEIRVWQVVEDKIVFTPLSKYNKTDPRQLGFLQQNKSALLLTGSRNRTNINLYQYFLHPKPIVYFIQRLKIFDRPLTSFAWLPDCSSSSNKYRMLIGDMDGVIEFYDLIDDSASLDDAEREDASIIDVYTRKIGDAKLSSLPIREIVPLHNDADCETTSSQNGAKHDPPSCDQHNRLAVSSVDYAIRVWDQYDRTSYKLSAINDATGAMAWIPRHHILAYATESAGISFYHLDEKKIIKRLLPQGGWTHHLVLSYDGEWLATANNSFSLRIINLNSCLRRPVDEEEDETPCDRLYQHYGAVVKAITWAPQAKRWIVANQNGKMWLIDEQGVNHCLLADMKNRYIVKLATWKSSESNHWMLAAAYNDYTITVWENLSATDHITPDILLQSSKHHRSGPTATITRLAFSHDGKWLAAASLDGSVVLYPLSPNPKSKR